MDNILFGDGEKLSEDASFQESGILDSTGFLELITFVEERFGIEITDRELVPENFDTLRKMSGFVDEKLHMKTAAA
jgi:acyl carrier protein